MSQGLEILKVKDVPTLALSRGELYDHEKALRGRALKRPKFLSKKYVGIEEEDQEMGFFTWI